MRGRCTLSTQLVIVFKRVDRIEVLFLFIGIRIPWILTTCIRQVLLTFDISLVLGHPLYPKLNTEISFHPRSYLPQAFFGPKDQLEPLHLLPCRRVDIPCQC